MSHIDVDARSAARSHFAGRARQPRGAHVLDADERIALHHFETRFEQQLLHERIADLHRRRFSADFSSNSADAIVAP